MKTKLLLTAIFSIALFSFSQAQVGQRARIEQGIRSGELTRGETARLRYEQRDTRHDIRDARKDGFISRRERREIRHDRRRNSRDIFRMKHNHRERHF